jgi:hypothetical protein
MIKTEETLEQILLSKYTPQLSPYNGAYTKTATFLLPMVNINIDNSYIRKYLSGAYLDDKGIEHNYVRPIFVLFKVKDFNEKNWKELYNELNSRENKIHEYDLGAQEVIEKSTFASAIIEKPVIYNLVMMVFSTPDKWMESYYHFKNGRYSKMSIEYKKLFPQFITDNKSKTNESIIWGAMNNSSNLKDKVAKEFCVKDNYGNPINPLDYKKLREEMDSWGEIWARPIPEQEIYRYKDKKDDK